MDWRSLIPDPDMIPAPWWVFEALDVTTFAIHILLINVVVGGSLILLATRLRGRDAALEDGPPAPLVKRIPVVLALGINFAVAPLLFVQVLYGHLIYTSSILMARYWMLVVPCLILAYYGAYVHAYRYARGRLLSLAALGISTLLVLYVAFMQVNNMTLMLHPERWEAYFAARDGSLLHWAEPTLVPRYLHFVTASIAVGGLFAAVSWQIRGRRRGIEAADKVEGALRIYATATAVQIVVGLWFLGTLPDSLRMLLLGVDPAHTTVLTSGILLGLASVLTANMGRVWLTSGLLVGTVMLMVLNRALLRAAYIKGFFALDQLEVSPQYGVMALFVLVLIAGLAAVAYMLRAAWTASRREVAE